MSSSTLHLSYDHIFHYTESFPQRINNYRFPYPKNTFSCPIIPCSSCSVSFLAFTAKDSKERSPFTFSTFVPSFSLEPMQ